MSQLVTNLVLRRSMQVVVSIAVLGMALTCLAFDYFTIRAKLDVVDDLAAALTFFSLLTTPFKTSFAGLGVLAGVVPVVLTSVCYEIVGAPDAPTTGAKLNRLGEAVFATMLAGLILGAVALVLFVWAGPTIAEMAGDDGKATAVQTSITAIVSFCAMYVAQILGLQPK